MAIVLEHAQAVGADLGVGGVDVGHVDGAGGEGAVGEVVVHARGRRLRQAVAGAQAGPAVGAVEELVGEHEAELRVGGEVGDAADAERAGARLGHAEGVAVVEAERRGHAQAAAGEGGASSPRCGRGPRRAGSPRRACRCTRGRRRCAPGRAPGTRSRCRRAARRCSDAAPAPRASAAHHLARG